MPDGNRVAVRYVQHAAVVTCAQAANARDIQLGAELKTLVLQSGRLRLAVHLRGDSRLRMRAVKRLLHLRDLRFVGPDELATSGLYPGTINPWNVDCRYHLLCLRVLQNDEMATNASALDTGQFFPTDALLDLPNLLVGYFGELRD